jgi:hypothetical protein
VTSKAGTFLECTFAPFSYTGLYIVCNIFLSKVHSHIHNSSDIVNVHVLLPYIRMGLTRVLDILTFVFLVHNNMYLRSVFTY